MAKQLATVYRSRPPKIRYAYVLIGEKNLHLGMSYDGLEYAMKHDPSDKLTVIDFSTGKNFPTNARKFMDWWKENYLDTEADYEYESKRI